MEYWEKQRTQEEQQQKHQSENNTSGANHIYNMYACVGFWLAIFCLYSDEFYIEKKDPYRF